MITNTESRTQVDEIASGIYRISTPVPPEAAPGGFTFNQFLVADRDPLLYHTGPRQLFPLVRDAIASVLPVNSLRYIGFSHFESDECGSLNEFLELAPNAEPLCGGVAKMVSIDDYANRPARALEDGETLSLGTRVVQWVGTPHLPHGWECGHLFEQTTRTLFCGDLFTQGGHEHEPLITGDILEPSEVMRAMFNSLAQTTHTREHSEKLAATDPKVLACMHGSAWQGDGAALIRSLGQRLAG